ncbi:uncharacterized protein LOC114755673, partial [Neltuma alba]|uniref:uncharacterized protein LOC114755673 n=1 Tax=Neltuma alba TaxID=207710 RepID=UPI0010A5829E
MELKLLILFLLLVAAMEAAISEAKSLKGCLKKCGEVEIPYPFGVGDNCSLEKPFNLTCDTSTSTLFYGKNPVSSISVQHVVLDGTVSNVSCQNGSSPYCACKNNTYHVDYYSNAGHRYKCKCKPGLREIHTIWMDVK